MQVPQFSCVHRTSTDKLTNSGVFQPWLRSALVVAISSSVTPLQVALTYLPRRQLYQNLLGVSYLLETTQSRSKLTNFGHRSRERVRFLKSTQEDEDTQGATRKCLVWHKPYILAVVYSLFVHIRPIWSQSHLWFVSFSISWSFNLYRANACFEVVHSGKMGKTLTMRDIKACLV